MQDLHFLKFMYYLKLISDSGVKDVPNANPTLLFSSVTKFNCESKFSERWIFG